MPTTPARDLPHASAPVLLALVGTAGLLSACGLGLQPFGPGASLGSDTGFPAGVDSGGSGGDDGGGDDGGGDDGGGDDGGGDGGDGPSDPSLTSVSVTEGPDRIEVAFAASDPDDDLEGGRLYVTMDGTVEDYMIPSQITDWRPSGSSTLYLELDDCIRGRPISFSLQVEDAAGNLSASRTDSLTLSGKGAELTELGNDETAVESLGSLPRDTYLCGDMYQASNDGNNAYTGDLDLVSFRVSSAGSYTFELTWLAGSGDYDLHLHDQSFTRLASAASFGTTQPERITQTLSSGQTYILVVAGWSGSSGPYEVHIR